MNGLRWLLLKDLQIMRRSPLLVGMLIVYPMVIAVLIGFALSRSPAKPRVAIVNLVAPGQSIDLSGQHVGIGPYAKSLYKAIDAVPVDSVAKARALVASGRVLGAVIIPPDIVGKLSSETQQAQIQVLYDGDALQQSLVQSTIESQLAKANAALSARLEKVAAGEISLLLRGGKLQIFGDELQILGLEGAKARLDAVIAQQPPGKQRDSLGSVAHFAQLAVDNLGLATGVLSSVGQPIRVQSTLIRGKRTPLDAYAIAVAASISLMFVCVLLASGSLALEREEHALPRLVRGLVSRNALLAEKALLGGVFAFGVAFAMLAGIAAFVGVDWGRVGLWMIGLAGGAIAFGAVGVAIGALTGEVRAASLLAFLVSLPMAFLALVPTASVSSSVAAVIRVLCALFPFKATLQAMDAAINGASPGLGVSMLHLLALTLGFGVIARVALRRLA